MLNKYETSLSSIDKALELIDNFETIINKFQEVHPEYKYKIECNKRNNKEWIVEIVITNDKQANTKASQETS